MKSGKLRWQAVDPTSRFTRCHCGSNSQWQRTGSPTVSTKKEKIVDYTFLANLQQAFELPTEGILSRVLHKDDKVNVTLFGFSAGQELSAHSAPTPAILYVLEGEAELQLGEDKVPAHLGSFAYMPPMLNHGIWAKTALRMLLVQMKG
jgi:quercetin dioxygenase-like cupin family protein